MLREVGGFSAHHIGDKTGQGIVSPHCPRNVHASIASYPPTSLSVERVRRRHQIAILQPPTLHLYSLRSSAIQPSSTPNLVAGSLQVRWLEVCRSLARILVVIGFGLRRENHATGDHRLPQAARHSGPGTS